VRQVQGIGTFTAAVTRSGAREDRDFATYPPAIVDLAPFTLVDLGAELRLPERLLPGVRLQLRAENVADVRYAQVAGFAAPGRTLYAGLKLHR
jgi:outer membrane receptor protein involved in Fe transport